MPLAAGEGGVGVLDMTPDAGGGAVQVKHPLCMMVEENSFGFQGV